RADELHALICTSSLELGIDIGTIRRVHQIQSPRAVDRMLQRLGRAEHHMGGTGRGRVLAWDTDGISEAAVIARRAMGGEIEGVEWRTNPGIVVANQLLQMSIERGVVPLAMATEILQRCSVLTKWEHESTMAVLRVLDERWLLRLIEDPSGSDVTTWTSKLWSELASRGEGDAPSERPSWEEEVADSDKEKWRRQFLQVLPESLKGGWFSPAGRLGKTRSDHFSMIPDEMSYRVRDAVTRRVLGSVDEAFVLSLGDDSGESIGRARRFVMAGRTWEIIDADPEQEELLVAPVKESGEAPIWAGELPPVPREVAEEVGRLRRSAAIEIGALPSNDEYELFSSYPLSNIAAESLLTSVVEHLDATGVLPDDRTMTVEDRDGTIVLNTCRGSKINETLAHFIQAMGSMLQGKMGRALVDPYRISFQVPGMTASNVIEWLQETPPNALPSILRMTIPNGLAVRWRVVQVARRMGVLSKGVDPRKVNLESLMRRYQGTPVIEESLDKLFHERMDIDSTVDMMREIQNGEVDVSHTASGPLGMSPKGERDLLLPSWSDKDLRERLEIRLVNERAVLICLNCKSKRRSRVGRMEERLEDCSSCGGRMQACAPERMESMLAEWVSSRDPTIRGKMEKNAELVRNHGVEAVMCLMGRGIAEETATRIMRGHVKGERIRLLRSIHNAELKYARTRRYWS
ncbi:MAG: helicase-related protein, partial [Candidatus Thermoplasmatota archaeon]|nr:helicase-related protein [Candidatus Thermoplasmatota archaeon]